jgi:tetratricopeptide (TPR) repeat protein
MSTLKEMKQILQEADDKGFVALSREICERLLIAEPKERWVLSIYADNLTKCSLYTEAAQVIARAEEVAEPGILKWILSKKGNLYEEMSDFQKAEEIYMQAHALDPAEPALLVFAASVAFRSGNIQRAIDLAREATLCPGKPFAEAYYNLAGFLMVQKQYEEARASYKQALEINPDYENARTRLEDVERVLEFMRIEGSEKFLHLHTDK